MYIYLIPLLIGFALTSASTFTTAFSGRWGERRGQQISFILRNILGMPLWAIGYGAALWMPSALLLRYNLFTDVSGWLLLAVGITIILSALTTLKSRAFSPSMKDTLVAEGLYARVRHPLYCGVILEFIGLALISPTQMVVIASALGIFWMIVQTFLEEYDLARRIPSYVEYQQRVPRFIPLFGKRKTID
jgi:protein-S-isoprenylcysteine O-methyltransferase Ste14